MTILSINRSCGNPSYSGRLQIMRSKDALFLINILPTETYLKGVVPSEMPASYHLEALKAQAVCARSYALSAVKNPKYDFADLNDSTSCQVYMNQGTDTQIDLAVDATACEVLSSRQKIVTAKYFSSSCMVIAPHPATQQRPIPRATTAAWLVRPPRTVRMPSAAIMPSISSGEVSSLTRMTLPFLMALRFTSSAVKYTIPVAAPGEAGSPAAAAEAFLRAVGSN